MSAISVLAACGGEPPAVGPPIVHADTLLVVAHFDDDEIFMQPELIDALRTGSVATIYVTSGDPGKGDDHAQEVFSAARTAYSSIAGSSAWSCGYVTVTGLPVQHCRLLDRDVSVLALDVPEGGREGQSDDSLLHLVEGRPSLPISGPIGGRITLAALVGELAELVRTIDPTQVHALDLAATHGRDHSSHLFSSAFSLWGIASAGFTGDVTWHRGYNVAPEPVTFDGAAFADAAVMLGFFEACYFGCAECGTSCELEKLDASHVTWMHRQYATRRVRAAGVLEVADGSGCLTAQADTLEIGACVGHVAKLDETGHLVLADRCAASTADGAITLAECAALPEQMWVLDSEGFVWNGRPPAPSVDMDYDHVRCLAIGGATATAPTCGEQLQPRWRVVEPNRAVRVRP